PPTALPRLFLHRSPAPCLAGLSWAPDPEHGRLLACERGLRVVRQITNPRLATPMAVTPLGGTELLVTEHTGEGVVVDTMGDGRVVREWESPDVASLYAAGPGRVAATRSPYYVPQLGAPEPDTAPLIRMLDTLGRPAGRLATIRRPATPLLDYLVNAGSVAVGPDGAVYYSPLVRDEIRKYSPGGRLSWTTKRGLFRGGRERRARRVRAGFAGRLRRDRARCAGAFHPGVRAARPRGRHGHAGGAPRQGDARQLLGIMVRPLPRGVPAHGGAVPRVRPQGLRDRGRVGRRGRGQDA